MTQGDGAKLGLRRLDAQDFAANRETGCAQGAEDRARRAWTRGVRLEQAATWGRAGLGEKLGRTPELAARRDAESREAGARRAGRSSNRVP
jgi:hypothetical protein